MEFVLQHGVRHGVLQGAYGVLYEHMDAAAVFEHGGHINAGLVDAVVHRGDHFAAQSHHIWPGDERVVVFVFSGPAHHQACGAAVVHTELGLQAVLRLLLAREFEHQGVHLELNAFDVVWLHSLGAQLCASINAGVNHDAASKGLVAVERNLKTLAQLVGDLAPVVLGGDGLHHAARSFQCLGAGRESLAGHQGRQQARTRRATGVKGLGHGAKLFAHAHGLRRGDAQRHHGVLHVQLEQPGACRRRTQRACAAGDVPAPVVVLGVHGVAHAAGHVNADHQCVDQLATRITHVFSQSQRGGGDGASRVDDRLEVGVVKIKGVGADAVEQRCAGHVQLVVSAQHAGLRGGLQHLHGGQG